MDRSGPTSDPKLIPPDDLDEALIAADDTQLLAEEKLISDAEIAEGEAGEADER